MSRTATNSNSIQLPPRVRTARSRKKRQKPRVLRIGFLGLGTVGQGLCRLIAEKRSSLIARHRVDFRITKALVRDLKRARAALPSEAVLLDDPEAFVSGAYDLVVECMGGIEPAGKLIAAFLERGVPVVTANKALLAERAEILLALAARNETALRFEASVAAGIPILGLFDHALHSFAVSKVSAILNGTSNFVLTRMNDNGSTLSEALKEAQRLGYAEADPALDLSGRDAAQKLSVLTRVLGGSLDTSRIETTGLENIEPADFVHARALGLALKPVAVADLSGPVAQGYVAPAAVMQDHPLAGVSGVVNAVHFTGDTLGTLFLSGPGAGGTPTAASMLDDMLSITTGLSLARRDRSNSGLVVSAAQPDPLSDGRAKFQSAGVRTRWFLSLTFGCKPGLTEDLLDFFAASGLLFSALHEFHNNEYNTLAGITTETAAEQLQKLKSSLNSAKTVKRFSAFRVVEDTRKEEEK